MVKVLFIDYLVTMGLVLGPIIVAFLLFCFFKEREQRKMYEAVIRYGIWKGSGEKIEY